MAPCRTVDTKFILPCAEAGRSQRRNSGIRTSSVHALEALPIRRGGRDSGIKVMQLGFQMLVDEKQSLKRSVQVAVASCHDFIDRNIGTFGSHADPLHNRRLGNIPVKLGQNSVFGGIIWWRRGVFPPSRRARQVDRCSPEMALAVENRSLRNPASICRVDGPPIRIQVNSK